MNDLTQDEIRKLKFHPENNDKVITLMQMPDGNWRGFKKRGEDLLQVREVDPGHALQKLLTHK